MSTTSGMTNVLLIGASRGLGCAIAAEYIDRGSRVVATVRGSDRTPLHDLQDAAGGQLEIEHLDINVTEQIEALRDRITDRRFDLLFVIAGITHRLEETSANISTEEFTRMMMTNALSPMRVVEALGQLVTVTCKVEGRRAGRGFARVLWRADGSRPRC